MGRSYGRGSPMTRLHGVLGTFIIVSLFAMIALAIHGPEFSTRSLVVTFGLGIPAVVITGWVRYVATGDENSYFVLERLIAAVVGFAFSWIVQAIYFAPSIFKAVTTWLG